MLQTLETDTVLLDQDFLIDHKNTRTHRMDKPHFHDGFEIHFTLKNDTEYYIENKRYVGNQGTVAVMNQMEIHRVVVTPGEDYERYFIQFKPRFLEFAVAEYPELLMLFTQRPARFTNCIQLSLRAQTQFLTLLDQLFAVSRQKDVLLFELKEKQKLIEILLFLNDRYVGEYQLSPMNEHNHNELLTDIIAYIKTNYSHPLTLDILAKQFFISSSTVIRLFKRNMGMTPVEFIAYTRVIQSRALLVQGYSVREVALRVGYKDDSSFIRKFKELQSISPKQYVLNRKGAAK